MGSGILLKVMGLVNVGLGFGFNEWTWTLILWTRLLCIKHKEYTRTNCVVCETIRTEIVIFAK